MDGFKKVKKEVTAARAFKEGLSRGGSQDFEPPDNPVPYPGSRNEGRNQAQPHYCQSCYFCDYCRPRSGQYGNAPPYCTIHGTVMLHTTYGVNRHFCRQGYQYLSSQQQYSTTPGSSLPQQPSPVQYSPQYSPPPNSGYGAHYYTSNSPAQQQSAYAGPPMYKAPGYSQEPLRIQQPRPAYSNYPQQESDGNLSYCRCGNPLQS